MAEKTTILILAAMHMRPAISELFCMSARRFTADNSDDYNIIVCALVSDQDSIDVCNRYGVNTF